jgi:CheY-like chemotaxis protein
LLNNAAKYTDRGGEIAVAVERVGGDSTITVRDNGIGIAPTLLPQLFEMFFQADSSLDRADGGLGIGLSVAKRLIELQGGRSEGLGKGSEFIIQLPAIRELENSVEMDHDVIPESQLPAAAASIMRRVLIVDDNVDTAEAVAEFATLLGHQVAIASNGLAALELAGQFRPDIALIDIGLPQMNGYELARRLRGLPEMAAVPLVAITGYAREEDRQAALAAGFNLHLAKPIEPARLEKLLTYPSMMFLVLS